VQHFVTQRAAQQGMAPRVVSDSALERLKRHSWPGNVRELRNTVERLMILANGEAVGESDVLRMVGAVSEETGLGDTLLQSATFEQFKQGAERAFLLAKLKEYDWNVSETARRLEMPRSNLYKKIERYSLTRDT
jgi:two-component system nitrogen regulation response regulator NtrX